MNIILHITKYEQWIKEKETGAYRGNTLDSQGFIHCSAKEQILRVANSLFKNQKGLVLIVIDSNKITSEIKYENLEGGSELFPHIYGPLNIDAVIKVLKFEPGIDGNFTLPEELSNLFII
ncbi:MAG TPA: DUF952 domain-containing protein [Caldisericia bacterium]|nr:DUF952 domain-containing protein [bacterium]HQJ56531.1 DUF952 domain-containing protein [Caldisericia bacterium]